MNESEKSRERSISWEGFQKINFAGRTVEFEDVSDQTGYTIKGTIEKIIFENDKIVIELKEALVFGPFDEEWKKEEQTKFELPKADQPPTIWPDGRISFNDCDIFDSVRILP